MSTNAPVMILVAPQMGENIGAAARAMWNFGLDRMRVVAPRDGWPNARAAALASGAGRVLDEAHLFGDTCAAVADLDYVFATTARQRGLTKSIVTPERAMEQTRALIGTGQKVGILFGAERAGLENVDIARANAIISVPVNPAFPSLNLAQCVLLTSYEWQRQTVQVAPETVELVKTRFANGLEREKLGDHIEQRLEDAGFFFPPDKGAHMKQSLRNMWGRLPLTFADVQILHGMMRQFARWKDDVSGPSKPE